MKKVSSVTLKLTIHENTFSTDDVVINNEHLDISVGDIVEVFQPDGRFSRLLLKVNGLPSSSSSPLKGSVSVQSSLATAFQLRQFNDVIVNKVNKENVTLTKLEVVFRDNLVTRSDAWHLHQSLIGSCVYYSKKCSFLNMRSHVNEMWMGKNRVACGVVGEKTRVVYRSQSAKFHIFVQMSCEMWNFDFTGDLYFEKAIMGFLQDLFDRWKRKDVNCNHQVVIVLFSRTYYDDVKSIDEFSDDLRNEFLSTKDGRLYKDFYKVIRQSEKQDNLQNVILDLKRSFNGYSLYVGCRQPFGDRNNGSVNPKGLGRNSRAHEGNLLEAINLSLNVFDKNYIDCNLEETNCTTLIISPSTGVFEVDKEIAILTENRLIENGVGVDLVCLAEQPLHAVPLLKLYPSKKELSNAQNSDRIVIPHVIPQWVNLSYYSKQQRKSSAFIPRMQVPPLPPGYTSKIHRTAKVYPPTTDHDAFDGQVFNYCKKKSPVQHGRFPLHRNITVLDLNSANSSPDVQRMPNQPVKKLSLQDQSFPFPQRSSSAEYDRFVRIGSEDDLKLTYGSDREDASALSSELLQIQQGDVTETNQGYCAINPFKPVSKYTLFKQRWLHAFPTNDKGISVREHQKILTDEALPPAISPAPEVEEAALATVEARKMRYSNESESSSSDASSTTQERTNVDLNEEKSVGSSLSNPTVMMKDVSDNKGASSEEWDWTNTILTGVDWKSLSMPACLPLTVSHFPDETTLNNRYSKNHYAMVIEDALQDKDKIIKDFAKFDRISLPPEKKFFELISQRISMGFQFVTNPEILRTLKLGFFDVYSMEFNPHRDYVLSLGLTIHHLKLDGSEIHVARYCLREHLMDKLKSIPYRYNLWPHNCTSYSFSTTEFIHISANNYNWNNLDRYICETEAENIELNEQMRYWRTRFLLLPVRSNNSGEKFGMEPIEGFLRFLEGINRIKRGSNHRHLFQSRYHGRKISSSTFKSDRRSLTPDRTKDKKNCNNSGNNTSPMPINGGNESVVDDDGNGTPRSGSFSILSVPYAMPPEHALSIQSPLSDIVKVMSNSKYGLNFLPRQDNVPESTFISAEAVAWMIKTIDGCNLKTDAVKLGQQLLAGGYIIHASGSSSQRFVDGFFLYFLKEEKKEEDNGKRSFWFGSRKTEEELLTSYNIQWLEVAVWRDEYEPIRFLDGELPLDLLDKRKLATNDVQSFKSMEYNLDGSQKLHRSEWCNIVYHGNYYPHKCAYMIELDWMVASGSVIADLVQKWCHKVQASGLHLVPAPMCTFPTNSVRCLRNPLRRSAFIHLNIDSLLKEGQKHLFEDFNQKTWSRRMVLFQEAVLFKFDFLRDIPQAIASCQDRKERFHRYNYIHSSGSLLVQINDSVLLKDEANSPTVNEEDQDSCPFPNFRKTIKQVESPDESLDLYDEYKESYGFFWVYNYALSKKCRNAVTGDVRRAKSIMYETFSDFCANKDNKLVNFWNECLQTKKYKSGEER